MDKEYNRQGEVFIGKNPKEVKNHYEAGALASC